LPRPSSAAEAAAIKKLRKDLEIDTGYKGRLKSNMNVEQAEKAIKGYSTEHAMAWDEAGSPLIRKTTKQKGMVGLTSKEMQAMRESPSPVTFTHNHPNDLPILSGASGDLGLAIKVPSISELRCVTPSKGGMRFRVTDRAKWTAATKNKKLVSLLEDADTAIYATGEAAQKSVERAIRSFPESNKYTFAPHPSGRGVIGTPTPEWKAISGTVYESWERATMEETLRTYNAIGRKHGFIVERF
jgi:hypothetical protein